MSLYKWSQNSSSNATADPSINYSEGQAPSTLNDSARAAMAAMAKFRDDTSGGTVTDASSTATSVVLFTSQGFDTLAHLDKKVVAFTLITTCGNSPTLNVDSLGAKPLRSAPNVSILSGTLIAGTPYSAVYNNTDGAFYLSGYFVQPSLIPVGASIDYWGATLPNSGFAFLGGQAISRATYSALFTMFGTTYGAGDGSTTFNLPDCRGRVTASPDSMGGGTDPNRLTSGALAGVRNTVGGAGGESGHTLTAAEIPSITSNGTASGGIAVAAGGGRSNIACTDGNVAGNTAAPQGGPTYPAISSGSWGSVTSLSGTASLGANVTSNNTGGATHNNMQPTILCNKIIRVL